MAAFAPPPLSSREPDSSGAKFTPPPLESRESSGADKSFGEHVIDAAKSFWDTVNPVKLATGLNETLKQTPVDTAKSYGAQNSQILQNAKDAWARGDHSSAIAHGVNYLLNGIPGVGAALDDAQNEAERGNVGTALGKTAGIAALAGAPRAAGAVIEAAPRAAGAIRDVATSPRMMNGLGAAGGAVIGHATGIPGGSIVGAISGREIGSALAQRLNKTPAATIEESVPQVLRETPPPARNVQPIEQPAPAPFVPQAPQALPSGRVPGSISAQDVPHETVSANAVAVPDTAFLDKIAQGQFGAKAKYSQFTPGSAARETMDIIAKDYLKKQNPPVPQAPPQSVPAPAAVSPPATMGAAETSTAVPSPQPVAAPPINPQNPTAGSEVSRLLEDLRTRQAVPVRPPGVPVDAQYGGGPRTMYPEQPAAHAYDPEYDAENTSNTFENGMTPERHQLAMKAAKSMLDKGVTSENLAKIETNPEKSKAFWDDLAKQPGLSKQKNYIEMSPATKKATIDYFKMLEGERMMAK